MGDAVTLGRPGGIPVRLHATWFLVAALVVWSLAESYFPRSAKGYSSGAYWAAAIVVAILFFASLLAHELAHSLVAIRRGLKVVDITLYLFGGVSAIEGEAQTAADEFWVTVVGPLTSLALAGIFALLWLALGDASRLLDSMLGYLATINLLLAIFNLLPGFPLDGGRVLRAIVWWRTRDETRATQVATGAGVAFGYFLVAVGILYAFYGFWVNGLWLVFLGWYLQSMAEQYRRQTATRALFAGLRVADLTDTHPFVVAPQTPLDQVIHDVMLAHNVRAVPVIDGDRFVGLLTLQRVATVPRERWPATPATAAMVPAADVQTASPDDTVEDAVARMQGHDLNQLPVLQDGRFVGLLSRGTVIRQLEIRRRLPSSAAPTKSAA